jgi:uncharacterized protein YdaU (DUF1376 family)
MGAYPLNYYQHHIGDYRRDTAHLTLLEHGIYRQILDQYYLDEHPICDNDAKLMRTLCARSAEEIQAVKNILADFFVLAESGYMHKRCDIEIEAFHGKSRNASESAKARWERVRNEKAEKSCERNANALPTNSEGNANHKPLTINHKTIDSKTTASASPAIFEGIPDQLVADFKALRKLKRAPLTQTAIGGIKREADKAGITLEAAMSMCCERGWTGFEAKWVQPDARTGSGPVKFDPTAHVNRNRISP